MPMPQSNVGIQYMVVFKVPQPITSEIVNQIPEQRMVVDQLFTSGKLLMYTLNAERTTLWAIFIAESESELISYIEKLPLTGYMDFEYTELMFYQSLSLLPSMSLN